MKSFRQARVTWVSDATYLGKFKSPLTANVHINGSAAAIDAPAPGSGSNDLVRVDRLLGVTTTTVRDGKTEVTEVTGRSELLKEMGLHVDDQTVTIRVKGGKCLTC